MIDSRARVRLSVFVAGLCAVPVGLAAAHQQPVQALLPDLVQERPSQLRVVDAGAGERRRFRLGFRSGVHNRGTGPLVLEGQRASTSVARMTADQVVTRSDGTSERLAGVGEMKYARWPSHRHWHYQGFDHYTLRRPGGRLVRPARKTGFCLGDRYDAELFEEWPHEPRRPPYRRHCGLDRPELLSVVQGISVGYGDDYAPQLEGQWIDVTGLRAGRYVVVHEVNANGRLREARRDNNAACRAIRLGWPRGRDRAPSLRVLDTTCKTTTTPTRR